MPGWLVSLGLVVLLGLLISYATFLFIDLTGIDVSLPAGWAFVAVIAIPSAATAVLLLLIGFAVRGVTQRSHATFLAFVLVEVFALVVHLTAVVVLADDIASGTFSMMDVYDALISAGAMANALGLFLLLLMVVPQRQPQPAIALPSPWPPQP